RRAPWLVASGLLLGTGFVMKQHGVAFIVFGVAWLFWELARRRERLTTVAGSCAWLLLGCALPFALTCLLLAWAGVFREFWFWTFEYARTYVTEVPPSLGARVLMETVPGVGGALLYPVYRERAFFFILPPEQVSRATYGTNPFPEAPVIAQRIADDTLPEDRVAVLGSEPEICFYARRRSATGYIYMYGLME